MTQADAAQIERDLPDVGAFIGDAIADAHALWKERGGRSWQVQIPGSVIEVRAVGGYPNDALFAVLDHARLSESTSTPRSIVYVIDAEATQTPPPPSAWIFADSSVQDTQRICWRPQSGVALVSDDSRGLWHLFDTRTMTGVYWLRSSTDLPFWEYGSPLRHFIHWTAQAGGQGMIHAAAIGLPEAGVLLIGRGGSGKSTMTAAAIAAGWQTVGDDFVIIDLPQRRAYPIFDIMKLKGMAEALFADAMSHATNPVRGPDEKALIPISAVAGERFVRSIPVRAILSLRLTGAATSVIHDCSRVAALGALAPSTMNILRTALPETLAFCGDLLRQVPAYSFDVGGDPREGLRVLESFVRRLA
jgi:hypothetical protein